MEDTEIATFQITYKGKTNELEPKTIRKQKCIREIEDTLRLIGPKFNKRNLSNKYGFAYNTIGSWIEKKILSIPKESIELISRKSEETIENTLIWLQNVTANPNLPLKEQMTAAAIQKDYLQAQADLLEKYGRKDKPADRSEISVMGAETRRILSIAEKSNERKKLREYMTSKTADKDCELDKQANQSFFSRS